MPPGGFLAMLIEQRYQEAVDRLSAREKIARGLGMFDWARGWLARQIVAEQGAISAERLGIRFHGLTAPLTEVLAEPDTLEP